MTYRVNQTVRLRTLFRDLDGDPQDPATVTLVVTDPAGNATTYNDATNDPAVVGGWYRDIVPTTAGVWQFEYTGSGGVSAVDEQYFTVAEVDTGTEPWTTDGAVRDCCSGLSAGTDTSEMILVASEIMHALSGRQFPGIRSVTIRPCAVRCMCGCHEATDWGCSACCPPWVNLDPAPALEIESVTIDGETLETDEYRLYEGRRLVRMADADGTNDGWPCSQRLDLLADSTEEGTFEITYLWGREIPQGGRLAAAQLACELIKSCGTDTCRLPPKVTSITRQGVSMQLLDPLLVALSEGRTGIPQVDLWVGSVNPHRLMQRPRILSPDMPRPWRVPT